MSYRATITLDSEAYGFLMSAGKPNRSAFINDLLKQEKQRALKEAIFKANIEEAEDEDYQIELSMWDITIGDGF